MSHWLNRKKSYAIGGMVFLLLIVWSLTRLAKAPVVETASESAVVTDAPSESATTTPAPQGVSVAPPPPVAQSFADIEPEPELPPYNAEAPLAQGVPSLASIRAEVASNPHVAPESLMRFSLLIHDHIEAKAKSEAGAQSVLAELEDCVLKPKDRNSHSVHALCLLNAQLLSERYPALSTRFKDLSRRASAEALKRAGIQN